MEYHIATRREDNPEKIAQIMSKQTGCKVVAKDIRLDVDRATTAIYSTIIHDKPGDSCSAATSIICKVRKWERKQYEYEVTTERLA